MLTTIQAIVRNGKIELLEPFTLPEGIHVLVTMLPDAEQQFWQSASTSTLDQYWNNDEDDVYADLLTQ